MYNIIYGQHYLWTTLSVVRKISCVEMKLIPFSGMTDLITFAETNKLRCSAKQLRTKIMNEQNKKQRISKFKMEEMMI